MQRTLGMLSQCLHNTVIGVNLAKGSYKGLSTLPSGFEWAKITRSTFSNVRHNGIAPSGRMDSTNEWYDTENLVTKCSHFDIPTNIQQTKGKNMLWLNLLHWVSQWYWDVSVFPTIEEIQERYLQESEVYKRLLLHQTKSQLYWSYLLFCVEWGDTLFIPSWEFVLNKLWTCSKTDYTLNESCYLHSTKRMVHPSGVKALVTWRRKHRGSRITALFILNTFAAIVDQSRFNNSCLGLLKINDDNNE
jgi:hypothetical protein